MRQEQGVTNLDDKDMARSSGWKMKPDLTEMRNKARVSNCEAHKLLELATGESGGSVI